MKIVFNGQSHETADNTTISQLLEQLKLQPRQVAVEVNRRLVPRGEHDQHILHEADQLEVVTLVGGG